jgi:membrane associated rhomboid family serine protease
MFMLVPLGKKGSTGFPIFTIFICVACIIVHVFASSNADKMALAFYPNRLDPLKMFTSVFTHGDFWHLFGNLFFFYCFARTIETQISAVGYLLAFVLFVFATNLAFAIASPGNIPTIGLSGVVWGYMGIFLFRYPGDRINCFFWFLWKVTTFEVPAFLFILAYLTLDIIAYRYGEDVHTNYVAHFSGFVAGALFRIALWKTFNREKPAPRRAPALGTQASGPRLPRR